MPGITRTEKNLVAHVSATQESSSSSGSESHN